MSTETKSSSPIPGIIIGIAAMVGGTYLAGQPPMPFIEGLAKQGIPLNPGETIAVIGVFLILFPVIKFFFINPLSEAINHRTTELEKTFSEAEDLRTEMTKMKTEYEQRLAATEADARAQIQAQIKEAQNLRQTLMGEAASKADELMRKATEDIESERNRVLNDIRVHVVDLTLKATEKVLGENMDSDKNRRLITDFIDKVEVAR